MDEKIKNLVNKFLSEGQYETAAYVMRDLPEVKADENLSRLVSLLASGEYGCSKNDVIGVIEILEKKDK